MFKEARIQLTAFYLAIIMTISLSFSGVIYHGINKELTRIENFQKVRFQKLIIAYPQVVELVPHEIEEISRARHTLLVTLGLINLSIFTLAGAGGYLLAGRTLDPIRKNMDAQKTFISDASHELRTPITSLRTELEVTLRDKNLDLRDAKTQLKSNLQEVIKIQKLANYLLQMNRLGHKKLILKKVDLKKITEVAIGKRKVEKDLKTTYVKGNGEALVELVSILLDNAFKYSDKSSQPKITVQNKKIIISDKGMGISTEDLPHIFDRFYRSDKSRGTEGFGLGLAIAKSISDAHNAEISVKSELGKGSKFTVKF